jgi:hypothetical protein
MSNPRRSVLLWPAIGLVMDGSHQHVIEFMGKYPA